MRAARSLALVLFILVPALAFAQLPDSVNVVIADVEHGAWGAVFGERFPQPGTSIGPLPIVPVEGNGETALPELGCDPLANGADIKGNIALVLRGRCSFVEKVQNAVAAGAVAVVVYNRPKGDGEGPLTIMGGDCEPDVCSVPAAFISRSSGLTILAEIASGPTDATIIPIRVDTPVAVEEQGVELSAALTAYPNPFGSRTTLSFTLPTAQAVRLAVYDVLGREVAVLVDGARPAGEQDVDFDASALPSGVYVVRVVGAGFRAAQRLTVAH